MSNCEENLKRVKLRGSENIYLIRDGVKVVTWDAIVNDKQSVKKIF